MVDGGLVGLLHVVVLEEGVDGQLPVHRPADVARVEDHVLVEAEAVEVGEDFGAEEGVEVERRARRQARPHRAEAFGHRHLGEVQAGPVDALEAVAVGDAAQLAVRVVGPGVVGADEHPVLAAGVGHQLGAAVLADVEETAQAALLVAGQQQRREQLAGQEVAGGNLAGTRHQHRLAAQDLVALAAVARLVEVDVHRQRRGRRRAVAAALFDQGQGALEQFDLGSVLHGGFLLLWGWGEALSLTPALSQGERGLHVLAGKHVLSRHPGQSPLPLGEG
ncbi:hypothetical protein D9M69_350950 [compost metagenome]